MFKAEDKIRAKSMDHEYAPISGSADFCNLTIKLALGDDSVHVKEGLVSRLLSPQVPEIPKTLLSS